MIPYHLYQKFGESLRSIKALYGINPEVQSGEIFGFWFRTVGYPVSGNRMAPG
jgi:hypothetical protein